VCEIDAADGDFVACTDEDVVDCGELNFFGAVCVCVSEREWEEDLQ